MARSFNGTSDKGSRAIDLSSFKVITLSFWLWWNSYAEDNKLVCELNTTTASAGAFNVDPNSTIGAPGSFAVSMGQAAGFWADSFTRPSAAAFHHYLVVLDRNTPQNLVWVDGVAQTLTNRGHNAAVTGTAFANSTLNIMCRNGGSLFGAGRLAEYTIWGGLALGLAQAQALAAGAPPEFVWPAGVVLRWPLWGSDSPEPDYSGQQRSMTLTGTSWAAHPRVMPGLNRSNRAFQPMPV